MNQMLDYEQTLLAWRQELDASLQAENGWLALAGLYWLKEGRNTFGGAPDNDIVLPASAPAGLVGSFELSGGAVQLEVRGDVLPDLASQPIRTARLLPDTSGEEQLVKAGPLSMLIIERDGQYGLRLWDNSRPERAAFPGRQWYPVDQAYCLEAEFLPAGENAQIRLARTIGSELLTELGGKVLFSWQGQAQELLALKTESGGLFLLFKDLTSGNQTYPAGRYLTSTPPDEHNLLSLDFNRAYQPPCAFTPYATCALPPAQNHLPFRVEAGERYAHP